MHFSVLKLIFFIVCVSLALSHSIVLLFPFAWHRSKTARQACRQAEQIAALEMERRHRKQHVDEHFDDEHFDDEHNADDEMMLTLPSVA